MKGREENENLLSDTKLPEDVSQDLFAGDLTGDLAQVIERLADVGGNQIGGRSLLYAAFHVL